MKRALLFQKLKKTTEAEKEFKAVIAQYHALQKRPKATTTEAAEAAAHAEFILSEDEFDEYIKYHLTAHHQSKSPGKRSRGEDVSVEEGREKIHSSSTTSAAP